MNSNLLGYIRMSESGKALKISLHVEAFNKAERYETLDGQEYVAMVIRLEKIFELIEGQREVTNVVQIVE